MKHLIQRFKKSAVSKRNGYYVESPIYCRAMLHRCRRSTNHNLIVPQTTQRRLAPHMLSFRVFAATSAQVACAQLTLLTFLERLTGTNILGHSIIPFVDLAMENATGQRQCKYLRQGRNCHIGCTAQRTLCHRWYKGTCCFGSSCKYSHGQSRSEGNSTPASSTNPSSSTDLWTVPSTSYEGPGGAPPKYNWHTHC